jgi:hypothetical protein
MLSFLGLLFTVLMHSSLFVIFFVLVLASPPRDEGEDASMVQVLDNDADLVCVQSDAHEQVNQEPSNKVLEGRSSDLHETPDAILERDELKIGCLQSEIISEVRLPCAIPFL